MIVLEAGEGRLELPNRMRGQTLDRRASSQLYRLASRLLHHGRPDAFQSQGSLQVNFLVVEELNLQRLTAVALD